MLQQLRYFISDYKCATGKYWFRGFYIWMSFGVIGILVYRIERGIYLTIGDSWRFLRVIFYPILSILNALSRIDINYHADIGGGLNILHPSMGIVINGGVIAGKNLSMVGGNVLGAKKSFRRGDYTIGENVSLGANAVIIGPVTIGDNVDIGASACVVKSCPSNVILTGVPATVRMK